MDRLLCKFFGHRRDVGRARLSNKGWRAPCKRCGKRLVRDSDGHWQAIAEVEEVRFPPYASVPRAPFSSSPGADAANIGASQQKGGSDREFGSEREQAQHDDDAEMFGVAFACYRAMLSRLADQFPRSIAHRQDDRVGRRSIAASKIANDDAVN